MISHFHKLLVTFYVCAFFLGEKIYPYVSNVFKFCFWPNHLTCADILKENYLKSSYMFYREFIKTFIYKYWKK